MSPLRPRAVSIERWPSVENPHAASPKGLSQKALKNIAAKSPHALYLSASYIIPLTRNNRNRTRIKRGTSGTQREQTLHPQKHKLRASTLMRR